jgi:enoyl-[acyl-carrier-protein] reductase (NADH)
MKTQIEKKKAIKELFDLEMNFEEKLKQFDEMFKETYITKHDVENEEEYINFQKRIKEKYMKMNTSEKSFKLYMDNFCNNYYNYIKEKRINLLKKIGITEK